MLLIIYIYIYIYWVVRKVCADFKGKLKRRRLKFLISFIKFKSFAARIFRQSNIYTHTYIFRKYSQSCVLKEEQIGSRRLFSEVFPSFLKKKKCVVRMNSHVCIKVKALYVLLIST